MANKIDDVLGSGMLWLSDRARQKPLIGLCLPWLLGCKIVISEQIGTAGTDGVTLWIAPKWFESLTTEARAFVLCHEALHGLFRHSAQMKTLGPCKGIGDEFKHGHTHKKANIAMDVVINHLLEVEFGTQPLRPMGVYIDTVQEEGTPLVRDSSSFSVDDNADWYWVFQRLSDPPKNGGKGEKGFGDGSDVMAGDEATEAEAEMAAGRAVASAASMAKHSSYGNLPGWLERLYKRVADARVNWKQELQDWHNGNCPVDFSFKKFKRPYFFDRIGIPTMSRPGLGPIAVFVDTSGSVTEEMLSEIGSELHGIWSACRPECIHIAYVDAHVAGEQTILPDDEFKLIPKGGGGTDFRPAFKWVEDKGFDIELAIYITDGYGFHASEPPPYPVLWVVLKGGAANETFPFGKVIRIE